jgi:hypothetical protein
MAENYLQLLWRRSFLTLHLSYYYIIFLVAREGEDVALLYTKNFVIHFQDFSFFVNISERVIKECNSTTSVFLNISLYGKDANLKLNIPFRIKSY